MSKNKYDLPKDWFKRYSRKRQRGREYYYNVKTKVKSWDHPSKNVAENSVAKWLEKNQTECDNSVVPFEIINLDDCDGENTENSVESINYRKLKDEYKKFEEFLASIEGDLVNTTKELDDSPVDLETPNCTLIGQASDLNLQRSPVDEKYCAQLSSMNENGKAMHKEPLIRRQKQQINRTIYQEQLTTPFYLVIDTDVFLRHLTLVANLLARIVVPGKPMVIIPYAVLQELDNVQMRTESTTSVLAMHAITFICEQLKMMPNKLCGQSAMDNEWKLIEILNANDSIINCCLQLKQLSANVTLLTNDENLTSKCLCSHIDAYSINDFETIS